MMNLERVAFGFFIVLALTLNVVFVIGEIDNPQHHNVWVLTIAILVSLIATGLKLGDRSQVGAILLSSSLVSDLLLIVARVIWVVFDDATTGLSPKDIVLIVAIASGALVANIVSVIILVGETLISRR